MEPGHGARWCYEAYCDALDALRDRANGTGTTNPLAEALVATNGSISGCRTEARIAVGERLVILGFSGKKIRTGSHDCISITAGRTGSDKIRDKLAMQRASGRARGRAHGRHAEWDQDRCRGFAVVANANRVVIHLQSPSVAGKGLWALRPSAEGL